MHPSQGRAVASVSCRHGPAHRMVSRFTHPIHLAVWVPAMSLEFRVCSLFVRVHAHAGNSQALDVGRSQVTRRAYLPRQTLPFRHCRTWWICRRSGLSLNRLTATSSVPSASSDVTSVSMPDVRGTQKEQRGAFLP